MEDSMDEIYGDLDDKSSGSSVHPDEDSVDIYSGLDSNPESDVRKGQRNLRSPRTMESMDIYEEIIREEQEEKEATYNELKHKFDGAQKQIEDLLLNLQTLQTKNSSLTTENTCLKKNICSLIKTARMEMARKDEEITRLSNRSGRGCYGPNFRRSHNEPGQIITRNKSNSSTHSNMETQGYKKDANCDVKLSAHTTTASTEPTVELQRCPQKTPQTQISAAESITVPAKQNNPKVPESKGNHNSLKTSNSLRSSNSEVPTTDCGVKSSVDETRTSTKRLDKVEKPQDKKRNDSSSHNQAADNLQSGISEKQQSKKVSASNVCRNQQPVVEIFHKSPLISKSLQKSPISKALLVSSQSSKDDPSNVGSQAGGDDGKKHLELRSSTSGAKDERSSQSSKQEKRATRDPHKREEDRQDVRSSVERRTRTRRDEQKSIENLKDKSQRDKVDGDREKRRNRSDSRDERKESHPKDRRHRECRSRKDEVSEIKKASRHEDVQKRNPSRADEPSSNGRKDSLRKMEGCHVRLLSLNRDLREKGLDKSKDRKRSDLERLRTSKDESPEIDDRKKSSTKTELSRTGEDGKCDRRKHQKDLHTKSSSRSSAPEDNTRKLSFMETLNLTLSPLKKQRESTDAPVETSEHTADGNGSGLGDEFLVIDELNSQNSVEEMEVCQPTNTSQEPQSEQNQPEHAEKTSDITSEEPPTDQNHLQGIDKNPDPDEDQVITASLEEPEGKSLEKIPPVQLNSSSESQSQKDFKASEIQKTDSEGLSENAALRSTVYDSDQQNFDDVKSDPTNAETRLNVSVGQVDVSSSDKPHSPGNSISVSMEVSSSTSCADGTTKVDPQVDTSEKDMVVESDLKEREDLTRAPDISITLLDGAVISEPDSTETEEPNAIPSSSVVFGHEEDSMMLALRRIRVIADPISPLTSPVRQRRAPPHRSDKQTRVRSPCKDPCSASVSINTNEVNMDMNKENKSPDTSLATKASVVSTSATEEDELEDGEILSEDEEERALFIQTPPKEKNKSTSETQSGQRISADGKREPKKKSPEYSEKKVQAGSAVTSKHKTSSKRRFKTVDLPLNSTVYTVEEFMNGLGTIREQVRKKYMKLHKNITKAAFCCIVDMSQASFSEFINSVDFEKMVCQGTDTKSRLDEILSSILSKVTKNGIVSRIFEQRAGDIKRKLWTFVDRQLDYLFSELKAALTDRSIKASPSGTTKEPVVKMVKNTKLSTEEPPLVRIAPPVSVSNRGLGSRGKNIRTVMDEDDSSSKGLPASSSERSEVTGPSEAQNKVCTYVRRLSNQSVQDKSDFEVLTDQQTSTLTFNLVPDSQMGEIFKRLLQGSDSLEQSLSMGDHQNWPVCTPQKEDLLGKSLIETITPNKLTPWSAMSSFACGSKMLIDPAVLDESCLLEVPSHLPLQSTTDIHRSYSILAEDLAVSMTIPSPLKSDSHLSFLNPSTGLPLSAPSSVVSAHYSEDALLDGEDVTEQDIHLSLDTDNSSSDSSPSRTWENSNPPGFHFSPNFPMQAVVMERSNDHFIVRIRRTSSGLTEIIQNKAPAIESPVQVTPDLQLGQNQGLSSKNPSIACLEKPTVVSAEDRDVQPSDQNCPSELAFQESVLELSSKECAKEIKGKCETTMVTNKNESEVVKSPPKSKKRKKNLSEPKAKRPKNEKSPHKHCKSRHKKRSKSLKEKDSRRPTSANGVSAKNKIKKKGEVVVAWTKVEDRDILLELKLKGASPVTFAALAKRLQKSTEQIEERFSQLLKLFKKMKS